MKCIAQHISHLAYVYTHAWGLFVPFAIFEEGEWSVHVQCAVPALHSLTHHLECS